MEPNFFPGFGVHHLGLLIYIVSFVTGKGTSECSHSIDTIAEHVLALQLGDIK